MPARYVNGIIAWGGINDELAPQASTFTCSLTFICPLEFSLVIPHSRVNEIIIPKPPPRVNGLPTVTIIPDFQG